MPEVRDKHHAMSLAPGLQWSKAVGGWGLKRIPLPLFDPVEDASLRPANFFAPLEELTENSDPSSPLLPVWRFSTAGQETSGKLLGQQPTRPTSS